MPKPAPPATPEKRAVPQKTVLRIKENGVSYPAGQNGDVKPALPQKTLSAGSRKLPLPPPPAKAVNGTADNSGKMNGFHHLNGDQEMYSNSEFDPEDSSLESTSVDDDADDNDMLKQAGRLLVFKKAEEVISRVVSDIEESHELCKENHGRERRSKEAYDRAKEQLTNESRQFVTASKLFVKSATESEGQMMECLNHCVQMIDRISVVTREVALVSNSVVQTRPLILKVKDVADTYLQTVQAAGSAIGKGMNDPSMGVLMKKATSLASVLTTLMRSLRVFTA